MISTANAPHSTWADVRDGWHLASASTPSVIQERMPPGTAEERHQHLRGQDNSSFSFADSSPQGEPESFLPPIKGRCPEGAEGLSQPGQAHQARNEGEEDAEVLVISDGISREDRQEA
ncbi:cupin domain-containing protein [Deinococcus sp. YIM 134068]|uniref:cupin domain-containing protein n=1 Tax=Deinococcus lichenicola TaxID=3118910 RepID=UPI002F9283A8